MPKDGQKFGDGWLSGLNFYCTSVARSHRFHESVSVRMLESIQ